MKKYHNTDPTYGQSTASRIHYWEKMGIANGIKDMIHWHMYGKNMKLSDWSYTVDLGNGHTMECNHITVVIPTETGKYFDGIYPVFYHNGKPHYIDMLCLSSELQIHLMRYNYDTEKFTNAYWHTVREWLTLEQTATLFEYIEDRLEDLIILPKDEGDKYNSTGALNVSINKIED